MVSLWFPCGHAWGLLGVRGATQYTFHTQTRTQFIQGNELQANLFIKINRNRATTYYTKFLKFLESPTVIMIGS